LERTINNNGINSGVIADTINGDIYLAPPKNLPTLLPLLIQNISEKIIMTDLDTSKSSIPKVYKIDDKIEYNKVVKYKFLIDAYGSYYHICNDTLNLLNKQKPNYKKRVFLSIRAIYLTLKSSYTVPFDSGIADLIIEQVKDKLYDRITGNLLKGLAAEDIDYAILAFVCYLFAECKILENPNNAC
jgi:hypothetical protein